MDKYRSQERKIQRKIKRCQNLISKDAAEIQFSEDPQNILVVCNAGLTTGLTSESLAAEIKKINTPIEEILMLPGKSYCFLQFRTIEDAEKVLNSLNGCSTLGQNGSVLYLSYCSSISRDLLQTTPWNLLPPPGLILLTDFVSPEEEEQLLNSIDWNKEENVGALKNRLVKHFGYEFIYGSNNVDKNQPLDRKIPKTFDLVFERLKETLPDLAWHHPEQMTVNRYEPGQGIPLHVDTHSPFQDPIISLSLVGDVVMEFRRGNQHVAVDLPRRSLLVMSGECRFGWTHGIASRMMDVVKGSVGLTARKRELRISCTFRKLQDGPCKCSFPELCDSQKEEEVRVSIAEELAAKLELENVHKVYEEIGDHFSETRHSPWPRVNDFIQSLPAGSVLADIGCGNGKYLIETPEIFKIGCDRSEKLLKVCSQRGFNVFHCDCLAIPLRDFSIDACISIAVIHHLVTEERRLKAVSEMSRILQRGGRGLIYVWAKNQAADDRSSSYLRQNKQMRKRQEPVVEHGKAETATVDLGEGQISLPVHTNRTQFKHQDLLVPWKLKTEEKTTFLRFYHVFDKGELDGLCRQVPGIKVIDSYYDQGNWCVIFEKI